MIIIKECYYGEFILSQSYNEAYKLWLWYNYQCELYDSRICTGKNEYEDYMPRTTEEFKLININARHNLKYIENERRRLKEKGIYITDEDWFACKNYFGRYKLKALEREYNELLSK